MKPAAPVTKMRIFAKVMETGLLVRTAGDHLYVWGFQDGREWPAVLRGKHRLVDSPYTSPVAVGDKVMGIVEGERFVIHDWEPRRNWLIRLDPHNPHRIQILCANVDKAYLLVTVEKPFTPLRYIDGFLVMGEAYDVQTGLLFTKADMALSSKAATRKAYLMDLYRSLGYEVREVSSLRGDGIEALKEALAGRVTAVMGLSGAGKSSLINALIPGLNLRTQPLVRLTQKGRHTTTYTALYDLPFGGAIIDTPGFGELVPAGLARTELSQYFPEMRSLLSDCKYNNCLHLDEPGCAVRAAVEAGKIAHSRYHTYLALFERLPATLRQ